MKKIRKAVLSLMLATAMTTSAVPVMANAGDAKVQTVDLQQFVNELMEHNLWVDSLTVEIVIPCDTNLSEITSLGYVCVEWVTHSLERQCSIGVLLISHCNKSMVIIERHIGVHKHIHLVIGVNTVVTVVDKGMSNQSPNGLAV